MYTVFARRLHLHAHILPSIIQVDVSNERLSFLPTCFKIHGLTGITPVVAYASCTRYRIVCYHFGISEI